MFPARFFCNRFFSPRFFPKTGGGTPVFGFFSDFWTFDTSEILFEEP